MPELKIERKILISPTELMDGWSVESLDDLSSSLLNVIKNEFVLCSIHFTDKQIQCILLVFIWKFIKFVSTILSKVEILFMTYFISNPYYHSTTKMTVYNGICILCKIQSWTILFQIETFVWLCVWQLIFIYSQVRCG